MQTPRYIVEIMSITILLTVMLININKIDGTSNNIVFLGIFAGASLRLLPSINKLITYMNNVKYAIPILNQLVIDIKQNYPENNYNGKHLSFSQSGEIKLENVYFHYDQNLKKEESILKNINLKIRSREFVGLYGNTGSGKSTLIDIISGLIKPNYGRITSNNIDIHKSVYSWRNKIGYVSQFTYLINDTIEKNIAFGLTQESIEESKINNSINNALLKEFINSLPLKSKTIVGENGISLSGGQIQRIGIARALYNNPSILIFDESTNSLDKNTEDKFMKILEELKKSKTIIFVSHKLELLSACDTVYHLDQNELKNATNYSLKGK